MTVEVLERVRQVGPNKQGAKGSYTIYPVASEPGRGLRWTEVVISTVLAPHLAVYGASSTLSKKRM